MAVRVTSGRGGDNAGGLPPIEDAFGDVLAHVRTDAVPRGAQPMPDGGVVMGRHADGSPRTTTPVATPHVTPLHRERHQQQPSVAEFLTSSDAARLHWDSRSVMKVALDDAAEAETYTDDVLGDRDDDGLMKPPRALHDMLSERLGELSAQRAAHERQATHVPRRTSPLALPVTEVDVLERATDMDGSLDVFAGYSPKETGAKGPAAVGEQPLSRAALSLLTSLASDAEDVQATPVGAAETGFGIDATRPVADPAAGVSLRRALSRAGLLSQRAAFESIQAGKVKVDNTVVRDPFARITAENDIKLDGVAGRVRFAPTRLWKFYKPRKAVISSRDTHGRAVCAQFASMYGHEHLQPIGSMHYNEHGLMLMTNDSDLGRFLTHPVSRVQQTYVFRVHPAVPPMLAYKWSTEGVLIDGKRNTEFEYSVPSVKGPSRFQLRMKASTAPKSHAAEVVTALGRKIKRGRRVSMGPYTLRNELPGALTEVAVPPFYLKHVSAVWQPFVDRDWPFFRRLRVERLKRIARFRSLTDAERTELDTFTREELRQALSFDTTEVLAEAERHAEMTRAPPELLSMPPLPKPLEHGDVEAF